MDLREMLLREFDVEMRTTRRVLERVPLERADFAPHERSTKLGALATHVARLAAMTPRVMEGDEVDFAGRDPSTLNAFETKEALLAFFDSAVTRSRAALEAIPEDTLDRTWTLRMGERVFFSEPRWMVHRQFTMNHIVHHRAQLGVYLRLLDVPVPSVYGPTADEG